MEKKRQEAPQGTLWNAGQRQEHKDAARCTGRQEPAQEKKEEAMISKSVIRRIKIQARLPAHVQERVDALLLEGELDQALAAIEEWKALLLAQVAELHQEMQQVSAKGEPCTN
jgi:hypothetical protein